MIQRKLPPSFNLNLPMAPAPPSEDTQDNAATNSAELTTVVGEEVEDGDDGILDVEDGAPEQGGDDANLPSLSNDHADEMIENEVAASEGSVDEDLVATTPVDAIGTVYPNDTSGIIGIHKKPTGILLGGDKVPNPMAYEVASNAAPVLPENIPEIQRAPVPILVEEKEKESVAAPTLGLSLPSVTKETTPSFGGLMLTSPIIGEEKAIEDEEEEAEKEEEEEIEEFIEKEQEEMEEFIEKEEKELEDEIEELEEEEEALEEELDEVDLNEMEEEEIEKEIEEIEEWKELDKKELVLDHEGELSSPLLAAGQDKEEESAEEVVQEVSNVGNGVDQVACETAKWHLSPKLGKCTNSPDDFPKEWLDSPEHMANFMFENSVDCCAKFMPRDGRECDALDACEGGATKKKIDLQAGILLNEENEEGDEKSEGQDEENDKAALDAEVNAEPQVQPEPVTDEQEEHTQSTEEGNNNELSEEEGAPEEVQQESGEDVAEPREDGDGLEPELEGDVQEEEPQDSDANNEGDGGVADEIPGDADQSDVGVAEPQGEEELEPEGDVQEEEAQDSDLQVAGTVEEGEIEKTQDSDSEEENSLEVEDEEPEEEAEGEKEDTASGSSSTEGQGAELDNKKNWEGFDEDFKGDKIEGSPTKDFDHHSKSHDVSELKNLGGGYEGDGFRFHILHPKGTGNGSSSAVIPAATGLLVAFLLCICFCRWRRNRSRSNAPQRGKYAQLHGGENDFFNGTFSDDISFGKKNSDDEESMGSYESDEETGGYNGVKLEMGGIHELDANGGLTLDEVNG